MLDKTGDRALEEDVRRIISQSDEYNCIAVSFRTCGKRVVVDVTLDFSNNDDWQSVCDRCREIKKTIKEKYPQCHMHFKIGYDVE